MTKRVLLLTTAQSYRGEAFLQAARRLGVEVVQAIDLPAPLAEAYNMPLGVDFSRPEEAASRLVAYARQHPLAAVLPVDDSGTLLAALVSQALGLPYNEVRAAEAARNKYIMRQLLQASGAPCPEFRCVPLSASPEAVASSLTYPCVVKPLLLSGSRGVIRADDPAAFVAAFRRTAAIIRQQERGEEQFLLVEAFIPGKEVALEGLLHQGRLHVLALFDKPDPLDGPFFEETIYVTPSRLPAQVQQGIIKATAQAAAAFGLRRGPIHAELRVNREGAWLVEAAGRSIGGLCSQTLRFGSDISLEELILRQACGLEFESFTREAAARGVMMIPIPNAGLLRGVGGVPAAEGVPGVERVEITAKLNYPLVPLPEGESYLGFIFARAETPAAVEAALRQAHYRLSFDIEPIIPLVPVRRG